CEKISVSVLRRSLRTVAAGGARAWLLPLPPPFLLPPPGSVPLSSNDVLDNLFPIVFLLTSRSVSEPESGVVGTERVFLNGFTSEDIDMVRCSPASVATDIPEGLENEALLCNGVETVRCMGNAVRTG